MQNWSKSIIVLRLVRLVPASACAEQSPAGPPRRGVGKSLDEESPGRTRRPGLTERFSVNFIQEPGSLSLRLLWRTEVRLAPRLHPHGSLPPRATAATLRQSQAQAQAGGVISGLDRLLKPHGTQPPLGTRVPWYGCTLARWHNTMTLCVAKSCSHAQCTF